MEGIKHLIDFLAINWTTIVVAVAILFLVIGKIRSFLKMSKEEQRKAALAIIKEEILKLMSESELYWANYAQSGKIKRAEVIADIYNKFPSLATFEDQETLIKEIDMIIDSAKPVMDEIINNCLEEIEEEKQEEE